MLGKRILLVITLLLIVTVPALATTWDAFSGWVNRWNDAGSNAPFSYLVSTSDTGGLAVADTNSYYGWQDTVAWNLTKYSSGGGHGWNECYWSPSIFKNNTGAALVEGVDIWTGENDWGHTESVTMPTNALVLEGNSSYIAQNSAAIRWTAVADGTYTVSATFAGACAAGTSATAAFRLGGVSQWSSAVSNATPASYTQTFTVAAGQTFDVVVTGRDAVTVNYSITDTPAPEPGSLMALGMGLVGLVGLGIRRRK